MQASLELLAARDYNLDLALFITAAAASCYLAFSVKRMRWLWVIQALSLLWFGFYRHGCLCPVGSVGNVLHALFHPATSLALIVIIWFVLPLLQALCMGRVFCGGMCIFGALQDALGWWPRRKKSLLGPRLERLAGLGCWAVLLWAAWSAWQNSGMPICSYDPFVAFFRGHASNGMWIFSALFLLVCCVVSRPFCRFLCPLSPLLGLCSKLAWRQRVISPDKCLQCQRCHKSCPMNCISGQGIDFSQCVLCGRCQKSCKRDAILNTTLSVEVRTRPAWQKPSKRAANKSEQ